MSDDIFEALKSIKRIPCATHFLRGRGLTPTDKAIWFEILSAIRFRGGLASLLDIAYSVECARSTVAESVKRLEAAGVLTVERTSGKTTRYGTQFPGA